MKMKKIISFLISCMLFGTNVFAENTALYSFEMPFDGDMSVVGLDNMFTISGSRSYKTLDKYGDEVVYAEGPCRLKVLSGAEICIYPVDENISILEFELKELYRTIDPIACLSEFELFDDTTCDLQNGTYILTMYSAGVSVDCRLIVGKGNFDTIPNTSNSIIRVLDVKNSHEIEINIVSEIIVDKNNVAQVVKDVLKNNYGYEILDVTYDAGVININYGNSHAKLTNSGSSMANQHHARICETIFACDFIKIINEKLEGKYTYDYAHYDYNSISYNGIQRYKINNEDYSKTSPEEALYNFYIKNCKNATFDEKTEAYFADLNRDGVPELLVKDVNPYTYLHVYEYVNGKIIDTENSISQNWGTGIDDDFSILVMEDGSVQILNSYIFDNGMTGEYKVSEEKYYIYNWGGHKDNTTSLTYDEFKKLRGEYTVASTHYDLESWVTNLFNEDGLTEKERLYAIWNKQKARYKPDVILKISSNIMFANGVNKFIDDDKAIIPILENGRTLVPLRSVLEALGAQVVWNNDSRTAIVSFRDIIVKVPIGSNVIYKNNEKITIDVCANATNGRIFVPIRAITEAFECKVYWDDATQTVSLFTN